MARIMSATEAVKLIKDGDTIHVSGFLSVGTPLDLIDALLQQGSKNLTVICNDGGFEKGVGQLIRSGQISKFICSWCGSTPEISDLVAKGLLEHELNPQGTLVERIRAAGYGLGGVLTRTGLNTIIEEGGYGQKVHFNGQDMLYHTPLKANFALTQAFRADTSGNLIYHGTARNFSPAMCMAADIVIASVVNPIEEIGSIKPDEVMIPGGIVDVLVQGVG